MPTARECYTRLCARFPEFTVGGDSNVLIIGRKVEGKRLTIKSQAQNKIFERNFKVVKIGIANKSIHCRILAPYKIARLIIS